jgi:LPS-assembly protein
MRGALALLAAAPAPARAAAAASPATCSALLLEPAAGQASAQQPPQSTTQPPAQQAPAGPSARPAQTAPGSPEAQAPRGTAAGTVEGTPVEERDPGEVRVRAESYEQVAKGQVQARGFVDLDVGGIRIQADKADIFEVPQPDGKLGHKIIAEGNVVFIRGEERMSGDRLEMDDSGKGYLLNAVGYVEPGVWVEGKRVDRLDDRTYKVTGGRFTSCNQPNPRWGFQSSSAEIEVDDKVKAKNAVFKIKGVPVFYVPYIYYPISSDGRSSGFLFPHFGYSNARGYNTGTGFFWVMGRSADQTFYADYWSEIGYGYGHELRYVRQGPSRGTFRTYVFDVDGAEELDYDLDWQALQMLPGNVKASVNVRQYSDILFQQRFQDDFARASSRTQRWTGAIEKDLKLAVLSAYADTTSTYFGTDYVRVNGRLPGISLRRFPRQIGWGKVVVGLQAKADRIQYGDEVKVDNWARFDVAPYVSRPFNLSFLEFVPSAGYRYTRYGASYGTTLDEEGNEVTAINGPPLDRSFFETQVEMRGPMFAKVWDTPGFGYSERFKHVIGPEVSWQYRTRVQDFNSIPKFDGDDYFLGTNQITYSLVQRFYAKRRGAGGGKAQPHEFLTWRIMQTYYVQISDGQNNFDPNYSSSAFGPGFKPEHLSPLMSRIRLRPTNEVYADFNLEYDVNFKQVRRTSVSANLGLPRMNLNAGWNRTVRLAEDPAERIVGAHTLRGNAAIELYPRRLFLEGSADYDIKNDTLWQMRGQLRYAVQCCGFLVEHIRYNWNGRDEKQWRFQIELENIGSIGSFLGAGRGGGAYR